jgi:SAM-dependent methyltransferase
MTRQVQQQRHQPQGEAQATACAVCGHLAWAPRFIKGGWQFARCRRCGLTSLQPLPTTADLERHYEASYEAGAYATFASADDVRTAVARHHLHAVRPLAPAGRWLDVGCSTGSFLIEAVAAGLDAEGIEVSTTAATQARARGATVHQCPVERFLPRRPYGVGTAFDVVEHLRDPREFLTRTASWLEPRGLLALTLPNAASWPARGMGRHWFYYAAPFHVHYFTPPTIRRLLLDVGFTEIRVQAVSKPLLMGYAADQLRALVPPLAPVAALLSGLARTRLGRWTLPLPLGEMLVTARRAE